MQFTSYLQNGHLTIDLTGEIDHHSAKNYMQTISDKLDTYVPNVCTLDFENVKFMDSSGIAVIISCMRNMKQLNGQLYVSNLGTQPLKVFLAAGLEKIVPIKEKVV